MIEVGALVRFYSNFGDYRQDMQCCHGKLKQYSRDNTFAYVEIGNPSRGWSTFMIPYNEIAVEDGVSDYVDYDPNIYARHNKECW